MFKRNERVICLSPYDDNELIVGMKGRIIEPGSLSSLVEFDIYVCGHDECRAMARRGWWCANSILRSLESEKSKNKKYGITKFWEKYNV